MQRDHVIADGGEHATDLVIAALGDRQSCRLFVDDLQLCREQWLFLAVQHQRTGSEDVAFRSRQRSVERRQVGFRHVALGGDHPMQEVTVIGDQDQAAGILVEPPHRGQGRIPQSPAARQQIVDLLAVLLMRTSHAQGLVHDQHQRGGRIDRDAPDRHALGQGRVDGDAGAGVLQDLAVQHDLAGGDQGLDVLAAAVAQVGQQPVQSGHQRLAHWSWLTSWPRRPCSRHLRRPAGPWRNSRPGSPRRADGGWRRSTVSRPCAARRPPNG